MKNMLENSFEVIETPESVRELNEKYGEELPNGVRKKIIKEEETNINHNEPPHEDDLGKYYIEYKLKEFSDTIIYGNDIFEIMGREQISRKVYDFAIAQETYNRQEKNEFEKKRNIILNSVKLNGKRILPDEVARVLLKANVFENEPKNDLAKFLQQAKDIYDKGIAEDKKLIEGSVGFDRFIIIAEAKMGKVPGPQTSKGLYSSPEGSIKAIEEHGHMFKAENWRKVIDFTNEFCGVVENK